MYINRNLLSRPELSSRAIECRRSIPESRRLTPPSLPPSAPRACELAVRQSRSDEQHVVEWAARAALRNEGERTSGRPRPGRRARGREEDGHYRDEFPDDRRL